MTHEEDDDGTVYRTLKSTKGHGIDPRDMGPYFEDDEEARRYLEAYAEYVLGAVPTSWESVDHPNEKWVMKPSASFDRMVVQGVDVHDTATPAVESMQEFSEDLEDVEA